MLAHCRFFTIQADVRDFMSLPLDFQELKGIAFQGQYFASCLAILTSTAYLSTDHATIANHTLITVMQLITMFKVRPPTPKQEPLRQPQRREKEPAEGLLAYISIVKTSCRVILFAL